MEVSNFEFGGFGDDGLMQADEGYNFVGKTALLMIIDCSPEMFQPWGDTDQTPYRAAINACASLWRTKIISNPTDLVGILLYGTEEIKNSSSCKNIYVLQDMSTVKVDMIKQLDQILKSDDYDDFSNKIGSCAEYQMKDIFWVSKHIFDDAKTNAFSKKIFFFTCNDDQHADSDSLRYSAQMKYKDMGNVDFNIVTFKENFDKTKFFKEILVRDSSLILTKDFEQLLNIVRMKQKYKRPLTKSTFTIYKAPKRSDPTPSTSATSNGNGGTALATLPSSDSMDIKMSVGIYKLSSKATGPKPVTVNSTTNETVEKKTTIFRSTGAPVLQSEIKKAINVNGAEVIMSDEDLKQLKYKHESGIELIGFVNEKEFDQFTWFRSSSYFLYPDDNAIPGSIDLFATLLKRCDALEKLPVVRMVMSRGRTPKLACLIPSLREENVPQGFHIFIIPFADETRDVPFDNVLSSEPELDSLMEKAIKKLTNKKYSMNEVPNPALQFKWRQLEEIALDKACTEEYIDNTIPDYEVIGERLDDLPEKMINEVRAYANQPASKKQKVEAVSINMKIEALNKRVEKLTVPVLKGFLDEKGIPTQGKRKADLVYQIYEFFDGQDEN